MDKLVGVYEKEVLITFELNRKCTTTLHLKNLMETMAVAFKVQTTAADKFCVKPPNGCIRPGGEYAFEIILNPQSEIPAFFPFSQDRFVVKTALVPLNIETKAMPERVPKNWFTSRKTQVFVNAKLRVVYIGDTLLRYAVAVGDSKAVKQILSRQKGTMGYGKSGRTALHIAASIGNVQLLTILLDAGVEIDTVDEVGRTPLLEAVACGRIEVVKELLRRKACTEVKDFEEGSHIAAIHIAATLEDIKVLEYLIKSRANLEIMDSEGRTALHFAAENGLSENAKALLEAGAHKNAQMGDGKTALYVAAEKGLKDVVHVLLEYGSDVHIQAVNGFSPAEIAAEKGHEDIVELIGSGDHVLQVARQGDADALLTLLQKLQKPNAQVRTWVCDAAGWTALHVAAFKGHAQVVRVLLLSNGGAAALRWRDNEGHTPLHCAAEGGFLAVVELLLAMGADPLAISHRGAKPSDLADALGYTAIAKFLHFRERRSAANAQSREFRCMTNLSIAQNSAETIKRFHHLPLRTAPSWFSEVDNRRPARPQQLFAKSNESDDHHYIGQCSLHRNASLSQMNDRTDSSISFKSSGYMSSDSSRYMQEKLSSTGNPLCIRERSSQITPAEDSLSSSSQKTDAICSTRSRVSIYKQQKSTAPPIMQKYTAAPMSQVNSITRTRSLRSSATKDSSTKHELHAAPAASVKTDQLLQTVPSFCKLSRSSDRLGQAELDGFEVNFPVKNKALVEKESIEATSWSSSAASVRKPKKDGDEETMFMQLRSKAHQGRMVE